VKISIDLETTPEEVRRLVGLPDVQPFNELLTVRIQERMTERVEGYGPMSLFQPYLRGTQAGLDQLRGLS